MSIEIYHKMTDAREQLVIVRDNAHIHTRM